LPSVRFGTSSIGSTAHADNLSTTDWLYRYRS